MTVPDLSNSLYVAQLRHIQSIHEDKQIRNPDTLVRHFLPIRTRFSTKWLGREDLSRLRCDPFYYYLLARTKYYDRVIQEAVSDGVRLIVSVGCGSDTRPYRFEKLLRENKVKVLECDQADAISAKIQVAKRWRCMDYVDYLPIDLNEETWPSLGHRLAVGTTPKTLVVMEGVSPYVNEHTFCQFLLFLAATLSRKSRLAYDYKIRGIKDDFGRNDRTQKPFRLGQATDEVLRFHNAHGFQLRHIELGSQLCGRLLPDLKLSNTASFNEDALVQLELDEAKVPEDSLVKVKQPK